jgi:hypothetical protein
MTGDALSIFGFSAHESVRSLYFALSSESQMLMRPGQKLPAVLLYRAFGLEPVGYHLVNASPLVANGILFILALRELGLTRPVAVAAATLYWLLPHYSTGRVWYASIPSRRLGRSSWRPRRESGGSFVACGEDARDPGGRGHLIRRRAGRLGGRLPHRLP